MLTPPVTRRNGLLKHKLGKCPPRAVFSGSKPPDYFNRRLISCISSRSNEHREEQRDDQVLPN